LWKLERAGLAARRSRLLLTTYPSMINISMIILWQPRTPVNPNPFQGGQIVAGSDIYRGTLDLMILQTLAMGTLHGYGISGIIRKQSRGLLDPGAGVLYPALRRLERMTRDDSLLCHPCRWDEAKSAP